MDHQHLETMIPNGGNEPADYFARSMEMRRHLETVLLKDGDRDDVHELIERVRKFLVVDPDVNLAVKKREIEEKAAVCLSTPSWLEIESTTRCNINPPCVMCHTRRFRSSDEDMDRDALMEMKKVTGLASTVSLHGGGEPLLVPRLFDLVDGIDPRKTLVRFSTNGLLLTERKATEILARGVGYINVSIDAATPETYRKIRHNDLDRLVGNVSRLLEMRARLGREIPKICLSMVIMKENVHEAPAFVELAHRVGADRAEFMKLGSLPESHHYTNMDGGFPFDYEAQRLQHDPALHDRWMIAAHERARELGVFLIYEGWMGTIENMCFRSRDGKSVPESTGCTAPGAPPPSVLCEKPWNGGFILSNGDVLFCCHLPGMVLGNVKKQPFELAWNGPLARGIRTTMISEKLPEICSHCHVYKLRQNDPSYLWREKKTQEHIEGP